MRLAGAGDAWPPNRMMADRHGWQEGFHYPPAHLGVTEAGDGDYGRIKSNRASATLLAEGLGDSDPGCRSLRHRRRKSGFGSTRSCRPWA